MYFYQRSYSIITIVRPSVRISVSYVQGKRDFLGPYLRYRSNFSLMHIPLTYEHLFYKYFVRRSVGQDTKRQQCKNMETRFFRPLILLFNFHLILSFLKLSQNFATYGCCYPYYNHDQCLNQIIFLQLNKEYKY